ncbi:glutamine--fructose-6-phosphate transaminase (isomerizing) [Sulfidibacter corallicola]|uniref:Glutamine--fructose-6-phosphate aminotransferase [isomerizing] n=1 Tax=Sulfidibacter corallicola TaxID=2818388 RepID=A0A8A4U5G1_SULCO|nr:glutamine--fructose-6-phosphate transaminase (isomerizing) [Sulfidibacter corallicola]QTD53975.1 glutamine--fructose-6-phosphate transaminase (isomerizing) [Sulfidibacter corallicola]
MCGIIGYVGGRKAAPILLNGLKRLEYRGYDSAGLVTVNKTGARRYRVVGRVQNLDKLVKGLDLSMPCGIAHTRWATHGKPTEANAHPHTDDTQQFYVAHNGIIENHEKLRTQLEAEGVHFRTETDTEVIVQLIAKFFETNLETAVEDALKHLEGTFGIAAVSSADPMKIVAARRGSPVIIGVGKDEMFVASDVSALVQYTDQVIYMEDNELAVLTPGEYQMLSFDHKPIQRETLQIDWKVEDEGLKGFPHFMLKEIYDQPETVRNACRGRMIVSEGVSVLGGLQSKMEEIKNLRKLIIVSCGTSYHAGLIGRYIFENLTDLNIEVELASEFRYRRLRLDETTAVLAISQSGETIDTLAAIREARRKGALTIGLVNVVGSTIARETDCGVYCHAGPEIGVASTKIFVSQLVILNLMALLIGRYQSVSLNEGVAVIKALQNLPDQISDILAQASQLEELAKTYQKYPNCLFIGRQMHTAVALEGALKLKEISYIHAEGYAAGEMKHGPISLIDENFPTIALLSNDASYDKMINNIQEIRARSGPVFAITYTGDAQAEKVADDIFRVPETHELLQPILSVIPLQLFAYYCARFRGTEIDKPRNLAKSVTVE